MKSKQALADLHRHLDGSLRLETLNELAEPLRVTVPEDLHFTAGMGLEAALALFDVTLAVLQTPFAVERVTREICEDAEAEGVSTLEIRYAPQQHHGAAMEEIVDASISGAAGRAGIVLCGLYGDPPELFDQFLDIASTRPAVCAIDIAGGPQSGDDFQMEHYAPAFKRALDIGVGRTVHAGEGRPAEEIRTAIEVLHAQRIGHGTTLLQDAELTNMVVEQQIVIEACPTSNWQTGAIAQIAHHPLPQWLKLGVQACINTDNTLFSQVDSPEEHRRARGIPGMTDEALETAIACGHRAAFRR